MSIFDNLRNAAGNTAGGNAAQQGTFTFTFQRLPESLDELKALPEAALDTPYKTAALTVLALCAYAAAPEIGKEMLNYLKGPAPLSPYEISFLNDRFRDSKHVPFSYFEGAKPWKNEKNAFVEESEKAYVDVVEKDGEYFLDTNIYDLIKDFNVDMISTDTLGKAFEPQQKFENPDGTPITFNYDFAGNHRDAAIMPGPFATKELAKERLM